ncbi:MAG: efflux RND transporter periplasmic adaptor subunit [Candidatus Brocadiia bacterium]
MERVKKFINYLLVLTVVVGVMVAVLYRLGQAEAEATSIGKIHENQGFPVAVQPPVRTEFHDYLFVDGEVVADVRSMLRAKVDEVVEAVHVRVGERVEKGQLLVEFRTTDLEAAIQAAQVAYEEAQSKYARYQNLFEQDVMSEDQLETARTAMENAASSLRQAKSRLGFAEVHSPINGIVEQRFVEPGEFKGVGKELLTIVDLGRLEVKANVPEQYVPELSRGQTGEFQLESGQEWLSGPISRISPSTMDPNRFFDVYLAVENRQEDGRWLMRPGMYAEVRFLRRRIPDAQAVPDSAIVYEAGQRFLYAVQNNTETVEVPVNGQGNGTADNSFMARMRRGVKRLLGEAERQKQQTMEQKEQKVLRARRVDVVLGLREGNLVQLPDAPLAEDSRLILNPQEDLYDGARVRVVEEGA